jgi:GT2 family glycosyltransferase
MALRFNRTGITQVIYNKNRSDSTAVRPGDFVDDHDWNVPGFFTREDVVYSSNEPRQVWAVYNTYGDTAFLVASIRAVLQYVDFVLVLYGGNWWNKVGVDSTREFVESISDPDKKIILKDCSHFSGARADGQLNQRTYGLSLVPEGHWHWLIDADEIYESEDAERIVSFLKSDASNTSEAWALDTIAYYQSVNIKGWEERFTRLFRSRRGRRFSGVMQISDWDRTVSSKHFSGPKIHHYSYVKPDKEIRAKFDDYQKRHLHGSFRQVNAEYCWKTWLGLRSSLEKDGHYVHPIPGYTSLNTTVVDVVPNVVKNSIWWLGSDRDVSVVVVSYNSSWMIDGMLESWAAHSPKNVGKIEWIFVDNNSKYPEHLRQVVRDRLSVNTIIYNNKNLMFTKAANQGMARARHRNILLLNPDIRFQDDTWLGSMLDTMNRYPNVGVCGCRMVDGSGKLHHGGGYIQGDKFVHFGRGEKDTGQYSVEKDVEWVTGALFLIRRECYLALGGLDEQYPHFHSDNKFCILARRNGFRVMFNPSTIIHFCGKSSEKIA